MIDYSFKDVFTVIPKELILNSLCFYYKFEFVSKYVIN